MRMKEQKIPETRLVREQGLWRAEYLSTSFWFGRKWKKIMIKHGPRYSLYHTPNKSDAAIAINRFRKQRGEMLSDTKIIKYPEDQ